jgi:hypothetical protein
VDDSERFIRTFSWQLLWLLLLSTGLVAEAAVAFVQYSQYVDGKVWSPGVIYGLGREIYRSKSPQAFWTLWWAYSAIGVTMVVLIVQQMFEIAFEDRRRQSDIGSRIALWGCGAVYLSALSSAVWYVAFGLK